MTGALVDPQLRKRWDTVGVRMRGPGGGPPLVFAAREEVGDVVDHLTVA